MLEGQNIKDESWVGIIREECEQLRKIKDHLGKRKNHSNQGPLMHGLIQDHLTRMQGILKAYHNPSCRIKCKSLCCHFPQEGPTVQIEKTHIPSIKDKLERLGLNPGDYLQKTPWPKIPTEMAKMMKYEDYVFYDGQSLNVWEARVSDEQITPENLLALPENPFGRPLWFGAKGMRCMFLDENSLCTLHADGLKPRICNAFVCSVTSSLNLGVYLGLIKQETLSVKDYETLKRMSERLRKTFQEKSLIEIEKQYQTKANAFIIKHLHFTAGSRDIIEFRKLQEDHIKRRNNALRESFKPGFLGFLRRLAS
jgi:Fe-S-cluster containining protein